MEPKRQSTVMATEEKQVNPAAFLKALNKKKTAAKAAAKAERPTGIMDDAAIMARLGLENEGDRVTIAARVSKIQMGFAKQDANRPYFQFFYSLSDNSALSDKGRGTIVNNYREVAAATNADGEEWRTEEQALEQLFFEFQALGENTSEWANPLEDAVACAAKHTAAKTEIQVGFSVYKSKKNGNLGLNISVVGAESDNSDLDESEDTESEDTEGTEEGSYEDWIGGWVTYTDDEGDVDFLIESYDSEADTFSGTDEDGGEWSEAPCDSCVWCEDQRPE